MATSLVNKALILFIEHICSDVTCPLDHAPLRRPEWQSKLRHALFQSGKLRKKTFICLKAVGLNRDPQDSPKDQWTIDIDMWPGIRSPDIYMCTVCSLLIQHMTALRPHCHLAATTYLYFKFVVFYNIYYSLLLFLCFSYYFEFHFFNLLVIFPSVFL